MLTAMRPQSDWELSSRLWAAGWQVGHHLLQGRSNDHTGQLSGTHKPETEQRCWGEHMVVVDGGAGQGVTLSNTPGYQVGSSSLGNAWLRTCAGVLRWIIPLDRLVV